MAIESRISEEDDGHYESPGRIRDLNKAILRAVQPDEKAERKDSELYLPAEVASAIKEHLATLDYRFANKPFTRGPRKVTVTEVMGPAGAAYLIHLQAALVVDEGKVNLLASLLPDGSRVVLLADQKAEPPAFSFMFEVWAEDHQIDARYVPYSSIEWDLEQQNPAGALTSRLGLPRSPVARNPLEEEREDGEGDDKVDAVSVAGVPLASDGPPRGPVRDQVFISYAKADREWLDRINLVLAPVADDLDVWDETQVQPGAETQAAVAEALSRAKVAVLLVTQAFLATPAINKEHLPALLDDAEGVTIFWIAVKHSLYGESPIAPYQPANDPETPLAGFEGVELDAEIVKIAEKIMEAFKAGTQQDGTDDDQ